nr:MULTISPECIES: DUF2309 domain-containing protein [unclassified Pseudomonas]
MDIKTFIGRVIVLLNESKMRTGLLRHCHVLAGLQNTTVDEIQVFDQLAPPQALRPS